jgi:DNA polymerase-1
MNDSIILIDGTNLIEIHHAANPATNLNGEPIGMVTGFIRFLNKINQIINPTKIIIFFDGKNGSFKRKQIYKNYKGGRKPRTIIGRQIAFSSEAAALSNKDWQFSNLLNILEKLPIQIIITDDYESDDGIAYCVKYKEKYFKNSDIFIVSCDKDFNQLVSNDVFIYNPINKNFLTHENFIERLGINQNNWLFFRAVCGDSSDCLSGVKGIGQKTLEKIFDLKSDIELSPKSILSDNSNNKIIKKLQENIDIIERNWKLMDLKQPLISYSTLEKLDFQIQSFCPSLNKKDFIIYGSMFGLNDLPLSGFLSLCLRKNNAK